MNRTAVIGAGVTVTLLVPTAELKELVFELRIEFEMCFFQVKLFLL